MNMAKTDTRVSQEVQDAAVCRLIEALGIRQEVADAVVSLLCSASADEFHRRIEWYINWCTAKPDETTPPATPQHASGNGTYGYQPPDRDLPMRVGDDGQMEFQPQWQYRIIR